MWMKIVLLASLLTFSIASKSESTENLRQVDHPPLVEEQRPKVASDSMPFPSHKPGSDLDISFYHGFLASLSVIIVSELGDKTWFIAVIMAMRHSRLTVFSGAMAALALMTVLSACLGWVTQLIPRKVTYYVSTALFALFGLKMLHEGYHMSASEGQEEFEEAQAEVAKREMDLDAGKFVDMEAGNAGRNSSSSSAWLVFSFTSRIFIEAFTMTFVAEWGDRSQLTTIILAARENIVGVISGGILGHAICTGIAVIGGKLVAQRISVRTVTIVGGVVFLIFALSSLFINDAEGPSLRVA
ncbi:Transmembrane protein [Trichostrongylus colubriformis]|uniref:GDT1 family protein n=1 Tax=Trichostrongylus colubriformis TaxID=6319 RepID=A0AAN8G9C7_TRICO